MDNSEKDACTMNVESVESEGDLHAEPKDVEWISTNYDSNIMCDSFTYLCTTAHLESLLKSAWWMNTKSQETASDQEAPGTSRSAPSTSTIVTAEDYSVDNSRQFEKEVTLTPYSKRLQSMNDSTQIPAKRRRLTNEQYESQRTFRK